MLPDPLFIGSDIYRTSSYGGRHPLAIPRVSTTIDLARAMDWLTDAVYVESPRATARPGMRCRPRGGGRSRAPLIRRRAWVIVAAVRLLRPGR